MLYIFVPIQSLCIERTIVPNISLCVINMSNNSYKDINGRWHAPLMNAYNNYCWYITGLQRLQCSPTLDALLSNPSTKLTVGTPDIQRIMIDIIEPIKIINKLNATNGKQVVDNIREYFKDHADTYKSTDGFSTNIYLSKYILPIIYSINGGNNDMTVKIMKEIGMNSSSLYVANEVISNDRIPIMNAANEETFRDLIYKPFHEGFIKYIQKNPFKAPDYASAEIELWSATNSGHVIPIIQQQTGTWIVFDDHRFVGELKDYLSQPYNFHKIKFSLTDNKFKRYVYDMVNSMSIEAKAINDFEISESLVYLTLINKHSTQIQTNPLVMAGGNIKHSTCKNNIDPYIFIIGAISLALAVILIIIVKRLSTSLYVQRNRLNAFDNKRLN